MRFFTVIYLAITALVFSSEGVSSSQQLSPSPGWNNPSIHPELPTGSSGGDTNNQTTMTGKLSTGVGGNAAGPSLSQNSTAPSPIQSNTTSTHDDHHQDGPNDKIDDVSKVLKDKEHEATKDDQSAKVKNKPSSFNQPPLDPIKAKGGRGNSDPPKHMQLRDTQQQEKPVSIDAPQTQLGNDNPKRDARPHFGFKQQINPTGLAKEQHDAYVDSFGPTRRYRTLASGSASSAGTTIGPTSHPAAAAAASADAAPSTSTEDAVSRLRRFKRQWNIPPECCTVDPCDPCATTPCIACWPDEDECRK